MRFDFTESIPVNGRRAGRLFHRNEARVKYLEIIVDNLHKAGWSYGYVSALNRQGRTLWVADACRDGKRFVMRVDKELTAFLELESAVRAAERPGDCVM